MKNCNAIGFNGINLYSALHHKLKLCKLITSLFDQRFYSDYGKGRVGSSRRSNTPTTDLI